MTLAELKSSHEAGKARCIAPGIDRYHADAIACIDAAEARIAELEKDKSGLIQDVNNLERGFRDAQAKKAELVEELEKWIQAVGQLSTLFPTMEVDVNDPLGMAQKVHAYVQQQLAAERARSEALEKARPDQWLPKSITVQDIAATASELQQQLTVESARVEQMRNALNEIKVRIAFIGWPSEAFWEPTPGKKVPDWRQEIALLEAALAASFAPAQPESEAKP